MKPGKVSENIIKRSILKSIDDKSAAGYPDCALFTGYVADEAMGSAGAHALVRAINRAAEKGCRPINASLSVTMPSNMREKRMREIVEAAAAVAKEHDICIINGHTETVDGLKYPIVSATVVAAGNKASAEKALPGQAIVMTKWLGIYGSALIATEHKEGPLTRYPAFLTEEAAELWQFISVEKEAQIAHSSGSHYMYACGDGGVFAGLWKLADRSGIGLEVRFKDIPVRQETIELCEYYDINPYKLRSDGSLLIATDNPDELVDALHEADIHACVIGHFTEGIDRVLISGKEEPERRFIEEPTQDELTKIIWYN